MLKKTITLAFLALSIASCDLSSDSPGTCATIIGVATEAVEGPTTAAINETITLNVSYQTTSNCGGFQSFYKQGTGLEKIITVNTVYDACNCDEEVSIEVEPYAFKESVAGVYVLKFKESNSTFVTHTVTVE